MKYGVIGIDQKTRKDIEDNIVKSIHLFLAAKNLPISIKKRKEIIKRFQIIKEKIPVAHSSDELIDIAHILLSIPKEKKGCIVEAGCFKGGSTAKLSIVAKITNRKLYVADSFDGLPETGDLRIPTTAGYSLILKKGDFCGSIEEVKANIGKFGEIECCEFIKGWYKDTLPSFKEKIVAVFCDVDLSNSTRDCIKYLYPNIVNGGYFFSQDIHMPKVKRLLIDENFWKNEVELSETPKLNEISSRLGYFKK